MKEYGKIILTGLLAFPLFFIFYLAYVHLISWLDPIISIVIGIPVVFGIAALLVNLVINLKDFVVSIFKEDTEVNEKGFKKHF